MMVVWRGGASVCGVTGEERRWEEGRRGGGVEEVGGEGGGVGGGMGWERGQFGEGREAREGCDEVVVVAVGERRSAL